MGLIDGRRDSQHFYRAPFLHPDHHGGRAVVSHPTRWSYALGCLLVTVLLQPVGAGAQEKPQRRTISVNGHSELSVAPDLANISVAVETTATGAAEAVAANAQRSSKVAAALKAEIGTNDKITTTGYTLEPRYESGKHGETEPRITGYIARNAVQIETHKLDAVGKMIDSAISAGANRVNSLNSASSIASSRCGTRWNKRQPMLTRKRKCWPSRWELPSSRWCRPTPAVAASSSLARSLVEQWRQRRARRHRSSPGRSRSPPP